MSLVVHALPPAFGDLIALVDEFNIDRPAPDPAAWYQVSSNGVNSFTGLGQLLAGNVIQNNVRNRSLTVRRDYQLRTNLWESTFTVGDAVNTGLENTHGICLLGNEMLGRAVYLHTVSNTNCSIRFRSETGSLTTVALGQSAPAGTRWRLRSIGGALYDVYRNDVKIGAPRTDPYGPLDLSMNLRPYHEQVSDRNAFGQQNWGSRVQRWAFAELGPPS